MYYHALIELPDGKRDWFYNRRCIHELEELGKIIRLIQGDPQCPSPG